MATLDILKRLDNEHGVFDCHVDIKLLIPQRDAEVLLACGFQDCSFGCDEVPSYYIPDAYHDSGCVLHVIDDLDDDHNRVSAKVTYGVSDEHWFAFDNVRDAIDKYLERVARYAE